MNVVEVGAGTDPDEEVREHEMAEGTGERDQAVEALGRAGVIEGLAWAWASARSQTLNSYDPDTGHNQAWVGFNAFTVITDRLDRVFTLGRFALPGGLGAATGADLVARGLGPGEFERMPMIEHGVVLRDDVNGSPGWRHGRWRILLQSYGGQEVDRIPWPQKSPTKQLVAQPISSGQLALPLGVLTLPGSLDDAELFGPAYGAEVRADGGGGRADGGGVRADGGGGRADGREVRADGSRADGWGGDGSGGDGSAVGRADDGPVVNLVAAYAIDAVTERSALHLGRPQLNRGGGAAWAWRSALDVDGVSEPLAEPGVRRPAGTGPRPPVADAPVRLRPAPAQSDTGSEGKR